MNLSRPIRMRGHSLYLPHLTYLIYLTPGRNIIHIVRPMQESHAGRSDVFLFQHYLHYLLKLWYRHHTNKNSLISAIRSKSPEVSITINVIQKIVESINCDYDKHIMTVLCIGHCYLAECIQVNKYPIKRGLHDYHSIGYFLSICSSLEFLQGSELNQNFVLVYTNTLWQQTCYPKL